MNKQLEEIKEALSKATPGPWKVDGDKFSNTKAVWLQNKQGSMFYIGGGFKPDDAELIANAPQWLASLVSEVEVWEETSIKLHKKLELQSTFILEMQKTLKSAEYNFQWLHNKFGSGEISAQDVLNKSAEFRREVDSTLQSLKGHPAAPADGSADSVESE